MSDQHAYKHCRGSIGGGGGGGGGSGKIIKRALRAVSGQITGSKKAGKWRKSTRRLRCVRRPISIL